MRHMKPSDIQRYFDKNHVKDIGSGCHAKVYATRDLVVKDLHGNSQWQDPVRECYQLGKERLGGFVVPFQLIDEVTCRIRKRALSFFPPKTTFQNPIIQVRIPNRDFFQRRFSSAIDCNAKGEVDDLIDSFFHTIAEVYERGVVLDMYQGNFVVGPDMTMRSIDLGALHTNSQRLNPRFITDILLDGLDIRKRDQLRRSIYAKAERRFTPEWLAGRFSKLSNRTEPVADIEL